MFIGIKGEVTLVVFFQTKVLSDVKILLREAAEREQNLLQEKEHLQSQVSNKTAFNY